MFETITQSNYNAALTRIEELIDSHNEKDTTELIKLSNAVKRYESKEYPVGKDKDKCPHCEYLDNIFKDIEITTEIHFIYTSMFTYLHNDKCYCDWREK